jgi:6-phosphogluconolactonase
MTQDKPAVRTFSNLEALSGAVAGNIAERIQSSTPGGKMFSLVLSGGNTPRALYEILGAEFRDRIPWEKVVLFWGDERYVSHTDPQSNYRMAEETLLSKIPIPPGNVHPMPTGFDQPQEAARAYEKLLRDRFPSPWPQFDLVLLGLGDNGHTASLFPHSPTLSETRQWVAASASSAKPAARLTLTLPALNHANEIYFLVAGAGKARALRVAITGNPEAGSCPAAMVRPEHGKVVWWADEAAAALLPATFRG